MDISEFYNTLLSDWINLQNGISDGEWSNLGIVPRSTTIEQWVELRNGEEEGLLNRYRHSFHEWAKRALLLAGGRDDGIVLLGRRRRSDDYITLLRFAEEILETDFQSFYLMNRYRKNIVEKHPEDNQHEKAANSLVFQLLNKADNEFLKKYQKYRGGLPVDTGLSNDTPGEADLENLSKQRLAWVQQVANQHVKGATGMKWFFLIDRVRLYFESMHGNERLKDLKQLRDCLRKLDKDFESFAEEISPEANTFAKDELALGRGNTRMGHPSRTWDEIEHGITMLVGSTKSNASYELVLNAVFPRDSVPETSTLYTKISKLISFAHRACSNSCEKRLGERCCTGWIPSLKELAETFIGQED